MVLPRARESCYWFPPNARRLYTLLLRCAPPTLQHNHYFLRRPARRTPWKGLGNRGAVGRKREDKQKKRFPHPVTSAPPFPRLRVHSAPLPGPAPFPHKNQARRALLGMFVCANSYKEFRWAHGEQTARGVAPFGRRGLARCRIARLPAGFVRSRSLTPFPAVPAHWVSRSALAVKGALARPRFVVALVSADRSLPKAPVSRSGGLSETGVRALA